MKYFLPFGMALALLLPSLPAVALAPPAKRATVEMPAAAQVLPGQPLTLGSVARINSNDLPLLKQLMSVAIGPTLGPGAVITLQQKRLAELVQGRETIHVEWSGAAATEISVKSQSVKAGEVIQAARGALGQWLQARAVGGYMELVSEPSDVVVPAGELELRIRPIGESSAPARRVTVWTEIWSGGEFYRALPTTFEVQPGEFSRGAGGKALTGDAKAPSLAAASATAQVREKETSTARAPLPASDAQSKLQVRRGQAALLSNSIGQVTVQTTVQVLQDGGAGQTIQVKSGSKNEVFYARVVGPGQLELSK